MENQNIIPNISPALVLSFTHCGSSYFYLEQIVIGPKVFEPLKFSKELNLLPQHLLKFD